VARAEYTVRLRPGLLYADHPCFARDAGGGPRYRNLTSADLRGIRSPRDFPERGTREATAADFALGIRRLADPRLTCPIISTLNRYVAGMEELGQAYAAELAAVRERRRAAGGPLYVPEQDEKQRPILLDYMAPPCEGVQVLDERTFKIVLKRKYPQILYWMAMQFFGPVPREAVEFYAEPALAARLIVMNCWPVGTGPYFLSVFEPERRYVLERNPHYREERYPAEGAPGDRDAGLLEDAGRRIPCLDRAVFTLEKESIPMWNKFLQGYYDRAGIAEEAFERTVQLSPTGEATLSADMARRGIHMETDTGMSLFYFGFNMLDDVVGGGAPQRQALRQAVSIALDYNEFLDIFLNGQGLSAQGVLPPGIFGYEGGEAGVNPYVDRWDPLRARPVRRPIEDARRLMGEAGYPDGRRPDGRPLVLYLDHANAGYPAFVAQFAWMRKRLELLGIELQERPTELKRFREKMDSGNYQLCRLGWMADYPDPENFLFLLYGLNAKCKHGGENKTNYENPEFDQLFEQMESMENSPERARLIGRLVDIARRDAPMCWGYHPTLYGLGHGWLRNVKPNQMTQNTLKYLRVDAAQRVRLQHEWNRPRIWPLVGLGAAALVALTPAVLRRRREEATPPC
jgi:ABC-type oligopeptide transport system substrate-binding subunit